jgi:type I restriction enzyme M protein
VQFFRKMRKSLNNKRNEIAPEQIDDLTKIYGEFKDGDSRPAVGQAFQPDASAAGKDGQPVRLESLTYDIVSKIFDNTDFGFRQITVERPLRLNFQASPQRIEGLREMSAFENLAKSKKKDKKQIAIEEAAGREQQEAIVAALRTLDVAF